MLLGQPIILLGSAEVAADLLGMFPYFHKLRVHLENCFFYLSKIVDPPFILTVLGRFSMRDTTDYRLIS